MRRGAGLGGHLDGGLTYLLTYLLTYVRTYGGPGAQLYVLLGHLGAQCDHLSEGEDEGRVEGEG